jgi:hypothetical protein
MMRSRTSKRERTSSRKTLPEGKRAGNSTPVHGLRGRRTQPSFCDHRAPESSSFDEGKVANRLRMQEF